jgi:hypothetical protein
MAKVKEKDDLVIVKAVVKDIKERVVIKVNIKAFLKYCGFEGYRLQLINESGVDSLFDDAFEIMLTREYIENTDYTKCGELTKD